MSSGETDVINIQIKEPPDSIKSSTTSNTLEGYYTPTYDYYYTPTYYWNSSSYWCYSPVYYYQITCPKCQTLNWAEVDKVVTCKGKFRRKLCSAKLKAVLDIVDYEIPVVAP